MKELFSGPCIICTFYVFLYLIICPGAFCRSLMFRDCTSAYDVCMNILCWIFLAGSVVSLILVLVEVVPWMVKGLKEIVQIA